MKRVGARASNAVRLIFAGLIALAAASACAGRSESLPHETDAGSPGESGNGRSGNAGATGGTVSAGGSGGAPASGGTGTGTGGAPGIGGSSTGGSGGTGGAVSMGGVAGTDALGAGGSAGQNCFEEPHINERSCGSHADCTVIVIGTCCGYAPAVGVRRGYHCFDDGFGCVADCAGIIGYVTDSGEQTVAAGDIQVACRPGEPGLGLCETFVQAYAE